MQSTLVYKTSDGKVFEREAEAFSHQQDLIGEELDGFIPYDKRGELSRIAKHDILLEILNDQNLEKKLHKLLKLVQHLNAEDCEEC